MRVFGNVKVSNNFFQHYLDISNGSIYNKQKLEQVSKKMMELPYVEKKKTVGYFNAAYGLGFEFVSEAKAEVAR